MKYRLILIISVLVCLSCKGQHYESDSVRVRKTYELVRVADEDGGSSIISRESDDKGIVDTTQKWEVDRNGDFIQLKHWYGDGTGILHSIVVQNETEPYLDTLSDGTISMNNIFTAIASDGAKQFRLTVNWQYVDLDLDGVIDQFRFHWIEPNAYHKRIIYCDFYQD